MIEPIQPPKCLSITALGMYETYKIDDQTIGIVWNIDDHDDLNFESESLRNIFFVDIKNKVINGRANPV